MECEYLSLSFPAKWCGCRLFQSGEVFSEHNINIKRFNWYRHGILRLFFDELIDIHDSISSFIFNNHSFAFTCIPLSINVFVHLIFTPVVFSIRVKFLPHTILAIKWVSIWIFIMSYHWNNIISTPNKA